MESKNQKYKIIKSPVLGDIRVSFIDHVDVEETKTKPKPDGISSKTQLGLVGDLEELGFGQKIFACYIHHDYDQGGTSFQVDYFSTKEEAENYVRLLRENFEEGQECCDEKEDFEDYYFQIHIKEVKVGGKFVTYV